MVQFLQNMTDYKKRRDLWKTNRKYLKKRYYSFHISLSKGFFAISFLLLVISSWNFHDVCQRFKYNQKQNFSWIRQKNEKCPHRPPLWKSPNDVTKVEDFYNGDLWGSSLSFVGSSWKCVPGYIKNVDTYHESFS